MSENNIEHTTRPSFVGHALTVSLTVNDIAKSVEWYQSVVGFDIVQSYEREGKLVAVSLKAGNVRILLAQDDGAKGMDRIKGEGFSFQITTEQDIDELANGIRAHGVQFVTEPTDTPWGARIFRLRDPDGFLMVVSSVRSEG